jgi:hypothetical protein
MQLEQIVHIVRTPRLAVLPLIQRGGNPNPRIRVYTHGYLTGFQGCYGY